MTTMTVFELFSPSNELIEELERTIIGKGADKPRPDMEGLIGLERKPHERVAEKPTPRRAEDVLLTLRDDLLETRRRLLKGASRRATLRDLDYTVDQIDNLLAEM